MKEETRLEGPIELGEKPLRRNSAKDWDKIKKKAQEGNLDEVPPDVYVRCYNQLKRIAKDHMKIPNRTYEKKCFWLWGKARTGKTRMATSEPHYKKLVNKWWDGYQDEKRVVIDDVCPEVGKTLIGHFKRWADPWNNQPGEDKGGVVPLVYDELYITSNHPPESMATGEDLVAIEARFEVIHFNKL